MSPSPWNEPTKQVDSGPNLTYAEQVTWRPLEADARQMRLTLEEDRLVLETAESILDRVAPISSNGRGKPFWIDRTLGCPNHLGGA